MLNINKVQVRKEKKAVLNNSRTRSTKAAAHEQYTVANRAVKKSVNTDKVIFIDILTKEAEYAAARVGPKHGAAVRHNNEASRKIQTSREEKKIQ